LWPLIYSIGNFLSISQERIGLRSELIWLHRMDSFSLLTDVFAGAELVPVYSLSFLNIRVSYALGSHATVFQSQVYAILACSEYSISEGIGNRTISICSDSRDSLLVLKLCAVSSRIVLQCGNSLQELALSNRVWLVWVPGHSGIHRNEKADAQK
jgi:hypothetical protein